MLESLVGRKNDVANLSFHTRASTELATARVLPIGASRLLGLLFSVSRPKRAGLFLQRHRFANGSVSIAMLTLPLASPGIVVSFMIILPAARQGLIGAIPSSLTTQKLIFAYPIHGLFVGYLFSIPRVILTVMVGSEARYAFEEARSFGAGPWPYNGMWSCTRSRLGCRVARAAHTGAER